METIPGRSRTRLAKLEPSTSRTTPIITKAMLSLQVVSTKRLGVASYSVSTQAVRSLGCTAWNQAHACEADGLTRSTTTPSLPWSTPLGICIPACSCAAVPDLSSTTDLTIFREATTSHSFRQIIIGIREATIPGGSLLQTHKAALA